MHMARRATETPDNWVILQTPDCYKIFATWEGDYVTDDRWRLNSGIAKTEQDKDNYYFYGFSGSCYKCNKRGYGIATHYGHMVLDNILEGANDKIKRMDDVDDWEEVLLHNAQ